MSPPTKKARKASYSSLAALIRAEECRHNVVDLNNVLLYSLYTDAQMHAAAKRRTLNALRIIKAALPWARDAEMLLESLCEEEGSVVPGLAAGKSAKGKKAAVIPKPKTMLTWRDEGEEWTAVARLAHHLLHRDVDEAEADAEPPAVRFCAPEADEADAVRRRASASAAAAAAAAAAAETAGTPTRGRGAKGGKGKRDASSGGKTTTSTTTTTTTTTATATTGKYVVEAVDMARSIGRAVHLLTLLPPRMCRENGLVNFCHEEANTPPPIPAPAGGVEDWEPWENVEEYLWRLVSRVETATGQDPTYECGPKERNGFTDEDELEEIRYNLEYRIFDDERVIKYLGIE